MKKENTWEKKIIMFKVSKVNWEILFQLIFWQSRREKRTHKNITFYHQYYFFTNFFFSFFGEIILHHQYNFGNTISFEKSTDKLVDFQSRIQE